MHVCRSGGPFPSLSAWLHLSTLSTWPHPANSIAGNPCPLPNLSPAFSVPVLTYFVGFACHWHFSKGGKQDSHVVCSSSNERWFVVKMHNGQLWPEKQRDVIFLSKPSHFQLHLNYNARFHKKMISSVTVTQYRRSSTYKQTVFQEFCKLIIENSKITKTKTTTKNLSTAAMLWMMGD